MSIVPRNSMIDIHAHILPGIDDGPNDWDDALSILRNGINDGIRGVICTSHVLTLLDKKVESLFMNRFTELKKRVRTEELNIDLWLGCEIHANATFDLHSKIATLNGNGKYVLMELPMSEMPQNIGDQIFNLSTEGVTPILAHPERNTIVMQRPSVVFEMVRRGVLVQINAGSVTGKFGRKVQKAAFQLLHQHAVHFVGSDCHGIRSRPMVLSKAYRIVGKRWGEETASQLFHDNPKAVIEGKDLDFSSQLRNHADKRNIFRIPFIIK